MRKLGAVWVAVLLAAVCWSGVCAPLPPTDVDVFTGKPRVIVISDIGNEPDDQMSFVRFLLYSNEFDVEAMIAATSTWQKTAVHPETMRELIDAYGKVRPNLMLHAQGWPEAEDLRAKVFAGQPAYGMAATGTDKNSDGAKAIIRAVDKDDSRPVWVCIWGGANTLAEALLEVRSTRPADAVEKFVAKLRVYSISDQDDAGPWMRREFPDLFYIVAPSTPTGGEYTYATWTGISGDLYYRNGDGADMTTVTNEWLEKNIRIGPLGKLYPRFMFIMEGDTPSFLGLIDNGLDAYRRPDWGGWGGRYVYRQPYGETHPIWTQGGDEFGRVTSSRDTVMGVDGKMHTSDQATIWRWREAFQHDFAARMSWTVEDFKHANHNPVAVVNGVGGTAPMVMDVAAGGTVVLDASASHDPDAQALHYRWFHYAEAGGGAGEQLGTVSIAGADSARAVVTAASACHALWLPLIPCRGDGVAHVILAVTDDGVPSLTSYRRIILRIHAAKQ